MAAQALRDLAACVVVALLAARLAPVSRRAMVGTAALWMAALCPFTADYTAVVLTEALATFFTAAAALVFVYFVTEPGLDLPALGATGWSVRGKVFSFVGWFLLLGIIVGMGTLVRPETPLVLAAAGIALCVRWWRRADWAKLILATRWMCVGLLLPLAPWAARNARTLGRVEFLAPRYAESQGDFVPRGFYVWTQTWMVRPKESYLVPWKLSREPILIETLPKSAFDSAAEYARVDSLLKTYNED